VVPHASNSGKRLALLRRMSKRGVRVTEVARLPYFLRSVAVTNMNFEHVWETGELTRHIGRTIPFLNTEAEGYQPAKLKWQLEMLKASSKDSLLKWADREAFSGLLN
jgi:hypothetical protein